MLAKEYSPLKIVHLEPQLAALRRGEHIVPPHVELVISDLCNQDCSFCAYRMSGYSSNQLFGIQRPDGSVNNNPNRMISYPKVLEILDDCQSLGVLAVQITGGGEPTVHPQHAQIFAGVLDRGMQLAVVSNGMRISDECLEQLGRAAWLRFSLDAGTPDTYARIRRVAAEVFGRVLGNIRRVVDLGTATRIGVSFVVTRENYQEIATAARIAKELGVHNFRISAVFTPEGPEYFRDFWQDALENAHEALGLAGGGFVVHNSLGERLADLEQQSPEYEHCYQQRVSTYIGADLNVYRCCVQSYNRHGHLGSLKDRSFGEVWQSPELQARLSQFDARSCERCSFNNKNRVLNYVTDSNPPDVAFT